MHVEAAIYIFDLDWHKWQASFQVSGGQLRKNEKIKSWQWSLGEEAKKRYWSLTVQAELAVKFPFPVSIQSSHDS